MEHIAGRRTERSKVVLDKYRNVQGPVQVDFRDWD